TAGTEKSSSIDALSPQTTPAPSASGGLDISALTYQVALSVGRDDIGLGHGFSLRTPPGWARLNSDGNIAGVSGMSSHCTSATHAAFLKTIGELAKRGAIQLTPQARAA